MKDCSKERGAGSVRAQAMAWDLAKEKVRGTGSAEAKEKERGLATERAKGTEIETGKMTETEMAAALGSADLARESEMELVQAQPTAWVEVQAEVTARGSVGATVGRMVSTVEGKQGHQTARYLIRKIEKTMRLGKLKVALRGKKRAGR